MSLWFGKIKEPNGWMGNMAPYPITYNGQVWLTVEAFYKSVVNTQFFSIQTN